MKEPRALMMAHRRRPRAAIHLGARLDGWRFVCVRSAAPRHESMAAVMRNSMNEIIRFIDDGDVDGDGDNGDET